MQNKTSLRRICAVVPAAQQSESLVTPTPYPNMVWDGVALLHKSGEEGGIGKLYG